MSLKMFLKSIFKQVSVVQPSFRQHIFVNSSRSKHVNLSYSIIDASSKSKSRTLSPSKQCMLIIHGLFGNKKNFESLAKSFSKQTGVQVVTVDARNHGSSEHADEMDYDVMSEDIHHLMTRQLCINNAIVLGHSMGGKIAMATSLKWPELVKALVVVDIVPRIYLRTDASFLLQIKSKLKELDFAGKSLTQGRKYASEMLSDVIKDKRMIDFHLTNLVEKEGVIKWRINIQSMLKHRSNFLDFPACLHSLHYNGPCIFIGGDKSDYIKPAEDEGVIKKHFPQASITMVPNAGHWVHADDPVNFSNHVVKFIRSL